MRTATLYTTVRIVILDVVPAKLRGGRKSFGDLVNDTVVSLLKKNARHARLRSKEAAAIESRKEQCDSGHDFLSFLLSLPSPPPFLPLGAVRVFRVYTTSYARIVYNIYKYKSYYFIFVYVYNMYTAVRVS